MLGKFIRNIRAKDKQTRDFYALTAALLLTVVIVIIVAPGYIGQLSDSSVEEVESTEAVGFGSLFSRLKNEFSEAVATNQATSPEPEAEAVATTTDDIETDRPEVEGDTNIATSTSSSSPPVSRNPRTVRLATTTSSSSDEQED